MMLIFAFSLGLKSATLWMITLKPFVLETKSFGVSGFVVVEGAASFAGAPLLLIGRALGGRSFTVSSSKVLSFWYTGLFGLIFSPNKLLLITPGSEACFKCSPGMA